MHTRTILIVDDDPIDRESCARSLSRDEAYQYELLEAETGREGLELAAERAIDCVVLDFHLPDTDGLSVLREIREQRGKREIPIVMLTGAGNETLAAEIMKAGCQDYVVKGRSVEQSLPKAIEAAIEKVRLRDGIERERKAREDSQCEQLALKDKFLSHVSHELRTPLTAVHQFLSLCLDDLAGELTELQREYLEIAFRNAEHLREMISDLMDLTRAREGKLRLDKCPVDLIALQEEAITILRTRAEAKEISLDSAPDDALPLVLADATRVGQVLVNLIENAMKFTPEGGSIRVTATASGDGLVRVSVADTGCGIDEASQKKIFERLHQESHESSESRTGLGLGLSICREIVLLQGGRIWVESQPGRGSTFHFTIPVFDLPQLLEPAITRDGALREAFGLLRVGITPADPGASQGLGGDQIASVRRLLRKLVYYPSDVVVPKISESEDGEAIYIVAAADEDSVPTMLARIRGHVQEFCDRKLRNAKVRIQGRAERIEPSDRRLPIEQGLRNVSSRIETLMRDPEPWKE